MMDTICRNEIAQLHDFLEGWLNGDLDRTPETFRQFEDALENDFLIVHPSGQAQSKTGIVADVWSAHGRRPKPFAIDIRNFALRRVIGPICLATYEEWQSGDNASSRLSTAIFKMQPGGNLVRWLHLHETFMPG